MALWPDCGISPFRGSKTTNWEGGWRVPALVRWPGIVKPGTIYKEMFASFDSFPTFIEIAGGPKGDELNKQIEAGKYPGFVKTKLASINQIDYLTNKTDKSARDTFIYYSGATLSAVRYKNWKFYYAMSASNATGGLLGVQSYHWTQVANIKRDPFEAAVGADQLSLLGMGGALAAPSTAYIYDWNLLPIGQMLWMKELMSYKQFPALQASSSYNLDQVIQEMQESKTTSHAGE